MSVDDKNPFRFVPTLKYMAAAKIIETLFRDPKYKEMMKKTSWDLQPSSDNTERNLPRLDYIIKRLRDKVDSLNLPEVLEVILKNFVASMVYSAAYWLVSAAENTPLRLKEQYWTETIYELISHLQWDNFGCVDGRKTLESYVSNRETINFVIWNQLCFHCMEDHIIRFSETIDWQKSDKNFASILPIYWYHKIYKKFPTKKMYHSGFYNFFRRNAGCEVAVDEEKILRTMFDENFWFIPAFGKTTSAIIYFRNYLKNDEEFNELAEYTNFLEVTSDVVLYILRTTKGTHLFTCWDGIVDARLTACLSQLPFILFFDDWMSVFETIDVRHFPLFIDHVGELLWLMTADRSTIMYKPFEEMWKICYRRFHSVGRELGGVFSEVLHKKDLYLTKLMFKELGDHRRILLIKDLLHYIKQKKRTSYCDKFSLEFSKHILKNDEERKLFSEVPKSRLEHIETKIEVLDLNELSLI